VPNHGVLLWHAQEPTLTSGNPTRLHPPRPTSDYFLRPQSARTRVVPFVPRSQSLFESIKGLQGMNAPIRRTPRLCTQHPLYTPKICLQIFIFSTHRQNERHGFFHNQHYPITSCIRSPTPLNARFFFLPPIGSVGWGIQYMYIAHAVHDIGRPRDAPLIRVSGLFISACCLHFVIPPPPPQVYYTLMLGLFPWNPQFHILNFKLEMAWARSRQQHYIIRCGPYAQRSCNTHSSCPRY